MSNTGRRLRESNEEILKYIQQLRDQRNELGFLVEKQKTEKANLESDMARISYKLGLINKSVSQRINALKLYDATIMEIEAKYKGLADSTQGLLTHVRNESSNLENSIDKRIGTEKDCPDCPKCEPIPQNRNIQRKSQGNVDEIPSRQMNETGRRNTESRGASRTDMNSNVLQNDPIYTRAMEYPMVLSPMIDKDQIDQIKEKVTGSRGNSSINIPKPSNVENTKERRSSVLTPVNLSIANAARDYKDLDKEVTTVSGSGNFIDGDYSDIEPNKDIPKKGSPWPNEDSIMSKDITGMESPAQSSFDYSRTTTPTDVEEKEKHAIDEYDEVLDDAQSEGAQKKISQMNNIGNNSTSVDTFGQAYKYQHELMDIPPSLQRCKKSIFNKRNHSLHTEEQS